jgi:hypothetical protein
MMPSWNQVVGFLTDWEGAAEAGCLGLCPWRSPLLQPTRAKRDNDHDIRGRVAPFTGAAVANRLDPSCPFDRRPNRKSCECREDRDRG